MSLYNMMFGQNEASDAILATLGLSKAKVGRFRDCWVEETPNGKFRIGVYTRNGGGNREECWCESWAGPDGKLWASHSYPAIEHEEERVTTVKSKQVQGNGFITWEPLPEAEWHEKREMAAICDAPDSVGCSCTACISNHVLPTHPLHINGNDDDFDFTYRTEYFELPERYADDLKAIALKETHDPSKAWTDLIAALEKGLAVQ